MREKPLTSAQVEAEFGMSQSQTNTLFRQGRIKTVYDDPNMPRLYWRKEIKRYLASRDPRGRKHQDPTKGKTDE